MPRYLTAMDLKIIFNKKSVRTIYRWVEEGREIRFDGQIYRPEKDAGGCWRFVVVEVVAVSEPPAVAPCRPAPTVRRRRILSKGVV